MTEEETEDCAGLCCAVLSHSIASDFFKNAMATHSSILA